MKSLDATPEELSQEALAHAHRHYTAQAQLAVLMEALQPLAAIPLEDFGFGGRPDQPIIGWNKHTLYVRDVLAARAALASVNTGSAG